MALKLAQRNCVRGKIRLFQLSNTLKISCNKCSTEVTENESLYPPVKPKYPPGKWKKIDCDIAWQIHDYSHSVLEFTKAKKRLDFLAGNEAKTLWLVEALAPRPNNLEFQKIITKTEILPDEPDIFAGISCEHLVGRSCSLATNIAEESESMIHGINKIQPENLDDDERWKMHRFMGNVLKSSISLLSSDKEYLRRSEIDQNVRVESFWRVIGFGDKEKSCDGTWELGKTEENIFGKLGRTGFVKVEKADSGIIQFQYRHMADFQVRTEDPLPEFLPMDDPRCSVKETKLPEYSPEAVAFKSIQDRPINVPGHWIGSPCEFTTGSVHIMPSKFVEEYEKYGMKYLEEAEVLMAMTSMFGSCVAQAQNQGFCDVLDITYPLTTQSIIINKHNVRFASYQLNTLNLWNDGNTLQNVMWISSPIKLFEKSESRKKQVTKEFMSKFLRFLLLEPKNRGIDMRPYLPEDKAPSRNEVIINLKGEEPIPQPPTGRWEHPKYSIYY